MNLTVGPLPPAVYWRRRAVVLGVLLLVVVLFVAMCSPSGESKTGGATGASTSSPTATSTILSPVVDGQSPSSSASSASSSPSSDPPVAATTTAAGPPPTPCLDTEMSLTVIVHVRKDDVELQMKVKNISNRACTRDVGGSPQEIHVTTGTAQPTDPVVWSSDYCQGTNPPPDVRTFNPGIESILPATPVLWSRKYVTAGCKAGNPAPLGTYTAGAKLGTLLSPAIQFTLT